MKLSREMRLLQKKWLTGSSWPKRIEWLEIQGLRGWEGQHIELKFPMVVICGENGSGKSTILQSAAAVYATNGDQTDWYASDFFPDTAWETVQDAEIRFSVRQGPGPSVINSIRKPAERWRGNDSRPQRDVKYIDLARLQPVSARMGFFRLAKPTVKESSMTMFPEDHIARLSEIMGRQYATGKMSITDVDETRAVSVVSMNGKNFSGFHQGMGEFTVTELLQKDPPKYSLVLIDEIETSLHPRAQRRLIRDLAELCRERELQIILTTHSPYVLEEFPPEARCYILTTGGQRNVVFGVSPDFAMTEMDDEQHPECDLYVEDERAKQLLREILVVHAPDIVGRVQIIPFGTANVGQALGQMVKDKRFVRPTRVFLDGDQPESQGCITLPGGDAPERVVFGSLRAKNWTLMPMRTGRDFAEISDACMRAMTTADHHEWVNAAANDLLLGGDVLWQSMAAAWAADCLTPVEAEKVIKPIRDVLT